MTDNPKKDILRQKAQRIINERKNFDLNWYSKSLEELVEELQIYQVELEQQNIELIHATEKIEQQKEKFAELFDNAPNGYIIVDGDYNVLDANESFAKMVNVPIGEIKNAKVTRFIHPNYQDEFYFLLKNTYNKTGTFMSCVVQLNAPGLFRYVKVQSLLGQYNTNQQEVLRLALVDITKEMAQDLQLKEKSEEYAALNKEYYNANEELRKKNEKLNQTNRELEQVKQFQQNILDNISDTITRLDTSGTIEYASPSWYKAVNYRPEEVLNKSIFDFIHPDDLPMAHKGFKEAFQGKTYKIECRVKHKDGSFLWFEAKGTLLSDTSGKPTGIVFGASNIHERKMAQQKLQESEEKLRRMFEDSSLGIYNTTFSGKFLAANKALAHMFGYKTPNELMAKIGDIHHQLYVDFADRDKMIKILNDDEDDTRFFETRFYRKDKSIIHCLLYFRKVYDNKLNENIIEGFVQDLTEKKKHEIQLAENARRMKMYNAISNGFIKHHDESFYQVVLDILLKHFECRFGYFGYLNDAGELVCPSMTHDIFGICQVNDKTIVFPPDKWGGIWGDSLKKKKTISKNKGLKTPEGHVPLDNAVAIPLLDNKELIGQIVLGNRKNGFSVADEQYLKDVCEYIAPLLQARLTENRYKKDLIKAKEKAEENDRLKSAFLANMSHEVRTPMNGILGFSEMFKKEGLDNQQRKKYADVVISSANRLLNVVDDILDISRIETGQLVFTESRMSLQSLMDELYNIHFPEARNKGLGMLYHYELDPDQDIVKTDEVKLHQILNHLINNAIKFTHEGYIKFGCGITDGKLEFYVEDTGIGIEPAMHEAVFERFRQVETDLSRQYGGTGLGLAICKKMVEFIGGKIWVESIPGKGAVFAFTIPLKLSETKNEKIGKPKPTVQKSMVLPQRKTKYKVLIADDEEFNLLYLDEVLTNQPVQVYHANDGYQAIEAVKNEPDMDIVLMDIKMPGIDGFEATQEIKKINPKLPVIAQTAFAMVSDREKALERGCDDYISKPIHKDNLLQLMIKYLGR